MKRKVSGLQAERMRGDINDKYSQTQKPSIAEGQKIAACGSSCAGMVYAANSLSEKPAGG
ncbi:hypothetical protein GIW70_14670 [Pseudomonas syringae]|nr:hypothetical protein [Pseudomonas syringae]MCF5069431.1 hypothetical protein [Pseudomonas syringae]